MKRRITEFFKFLKQNKALTKSLSFILSLILIFYVIPSSIYTKAAEAIQSIGENNIETTTGDLSDAEYNNTESDLIDRKIYEVIEKREENAKHFRLSDGTYIAAQYDFAVHFLDADGKWQDINNSLYESGSEFSSGDEKIKFAKKITGNDTLFTLHDGSSKITLCLEGAQKGTKGSVINNRDSNEETELQKMMNLENISSRIIYEDILSGVDIEYIVHSKNIKENIIVKEKRDTYLYSFELKLNGLSPTLNVNGDIELRDDATDEIKYVIPAPVVYDSQGIYAPHGVAYYTLTHENGGKYTLGVSVNAEWMNSKTRAFPVTVDPTIRAPHLFVTDTYIDSSNPSYSGEESEHLYVSDGKISYWYCSQMPAVPVSAFITEAKIALISTPTDTNNGYVGVYEVTTSWFDPFSWNEHVNSNKGAISSIATDYHSVSKNEINYFDVTETVLKWYDERQGWSFNQHGFAFAKLDGYDANVEFYSNDHASLQPTLTISYVDMKGVEAYWPFSSHGTRAGSGSINLANGNLVFAIPTLATTDSLFGYTPTLVYNSFICNEKYYQSTDRQTGYFTSSTARGFKISACETIIERIVNIDSATTLHYYVYADSDGTEHDLYATASPGVFKDSDGLGFILIVSDNSLELTDDSKTVRKFYKIENSAPYLSESDWYLAEIEDVSGNKLVFTVDSSYRPTAVKLLPNGASSATEMLKLLYTSDNTLCAVYNPTSKHSVILRHSTEPDSSIIYYGCNYLRKVQYCYGNSSTTEADIFSFATSNNSNSNITVYDTNEYNYDSEGRLAEVKNISSGMTLRYEYDGCRVINVSEYADETLGQELEITYGIRHTKVISCGNDEVLDTEDDIFTYYTLDGYGRAISTYSCTVDGKEILGGVCGIYDTQEESKNSITQKTVLGQVRENLLLNGDFSGPKLMPSMVSNWIASGVSKETGNNVEEPEKLLLSMLPTDTSASSISQNLTLNSGEYTFSMRYDTKDCENIFGKVEIINRETSAILHSADVILNESENEKSEIFSTNFSILGTTPITLCISFTANGTVNSERSIKIGKAKLEKGDSVSDYTLINAGGFETNHASSFWTANAGEISIHTDTETENKSLKLTANGGVNYVKQTLLTKTDAELGALGDAMLSGINPELRFALSGYAKAENPLPSKDFSIYVEITYYRGEYMGSFTERYPVEFSVISDEWQYACGTFSLNKDSSGRDLQDYICVQSVSIVCDYSYQLYGHAYFDDISITYIGQDKTERTEYKNGLVVMSDNGTYRTYYEYDANRNVKRVADSNGNLVDYYYAADNVNTVDHTVQYTYTYIGSTLVYPYHEDNPDEHIEKTARFRTDYTYNEYGMVTQIHTYATSTGNAYTIGQSHTKQAYTYETTADSKIFGALLTETDAVTANKYFYDNSTGWLLAAVNTRQSTGYAYTYDNAGKLLSVDRVMYSSSSDTYSDSQDTSTLEYEYDGADRLTGITTGSTAYTLTYDIFGNSESISIGNRGLAEYEYNNNNGKLQRIIYGNGYEVEYVYNDLEQLEAIRHKADESAEYITAYEYEYTSDGQIHSFKDNITSRITVYRYDGYDRLIGISEYEDSEDVIHTELSYDKNSRIEAADTYISYSRVNGGVAIKNTEAIKYTYSYLDDGRLDGYTILSGFTVNAAYSYDDLDRIREVEYNISENNLSISSVYAYTNSVNYGASERVYSYTSTVGNDSQSYGYVYNGDGNITKMTYSGGKVIEYEYDIYGRVVSENNDLTGLYYTYTYDDAGNITKVTQQSQSTLSDGGLIMGEIGDETTDTLAIKPILPEVTTNTYAYTDSEWGDLLTSYNGTAITYDEIGNPLSYYNGSSYTFTWQGRRLMTATKGTKNMSFEYNSDGLRINKTVNGVTTNYIYDGDLLAAEYTDTRVIIYIYDANGSPIGFKYKATGYAEDLWDVYWYGKNLQGDIVAVYSSNGTKLINYTYNAWGTTTKTYSNGGANTTATYNNLTYRGYYYDSDLDMYYLQTRYYDANICRFINADSALYDKIFGYNIFIYCDDNPINFIDPTGEFCVAHIDDRNYLDDWLLEGAGAGGYGASCNYFGYGTAYYNYSVYSVTSSYNASCGGYYYGSVSTGITNASYYYVPGAVSVDDSMATTNVGSTGNGKTFGGGGVTDTIKIDNKTITFGHGSRHLSENMSISKVNMAIANDVIFKKPTVGIVGHGTINVDGVSISYHYFTRSPSLINVGTYYIIP